MTIVSYWHNGGWETVGWDLWQDIQSNPETRVDVADEDVIIYEDLFIEEEEYSGE